MKEIRNLHSNNLQRLIDTAVALDVEWRDLVESAQSVDDLIAKFREARIAATIELVRRTGMAKNMRSESLT
jgi:hypothetical protein